MRRNLKNPNRWRRRLAAEKCLALVLVFACIIIHMAGAKQHNETTANDKSMTCPDDLRQSKICHSPGCIHTASSVLSKIKPEIRPCDDFYQFACGGYVDKAQIPEGRMSTDTFSVVSDKLQEQLKIIMEEERPETDPKHLKMPHILYKACMNKTVIENLGSEPIKLLGNLLGGWPVLEGHYWDYNNTWRWQDAVKMSRQLGLTTSSLISLSINIDLRNKNRRIIHLDQPSFGLYLEHLVEGFDEAMVSAYFDYIVDVAVDLGAERKAAVREIRQSVEFEIKLAKISWSNIERFNPNNLYNLRSIKQLQEEYPNIQWLDYINSLLPKGIDVDENEIVNLMVPSYFKELNKLLKITDKRVIANYLVGRVYERSTVFLSEEFRKRQFKFLSILWGVHEEQPRWLECLQITTGRDSVLGIAVGALYARKYFNQNSLSFVLEMVNNILKVFRKTLHEVEWMDDMTKIQAKEKFHAMNAQIAYPKELLADDILEDYYSKLKICPSKYYYSILRMNIFRTDNLLGKLRQPVKKDDWIESDRPYTIDAHYSPTTNTIYFPAGILQGHFFNSQRPMYMNYGAIGSLISHEITHAFDDRGRKYNFEGKLNDWWQTYTKRAYIKKAKCILKQYGNYTDKQTGLKVSGIQTLSENIADNGGLKISYAAYKHWINENGNEPKLPGLNYTPQQMFWISAAQTWCSKHKPEALQMSATTPTHLSGELRVLGTLTNLKDFSSDFHCPVGSTMNPAEKCDVW